jgi:hypothetical protein
METTTEETKKVYDLEGNYKDFSDFYNNILSEETKKKLLYSILNHFPLNCGVNINYDTSFNTSINFSNILSSEEKIKIEEAIKENYKEVIQSNIKKVYAFVEQLEIP